MNIFSLLYDALLESKALVPIKDLERISIVFDEVIDIYQLKNSKYFGLGG